MKIDNFAIWFSHNKTLLNMTLFGLHIIVWMWSIDYFKVAPKHYRRFRVWRFCNLTFYGAGQP